MNLAIRLLIALGKAGHGLANFITSLSLATWLHSGDPETITKWFRSPPNSSNKFWSSYRRKMRKSKRCSLNFSS